MKRFDGKSIALIIRSLLKKQVKVEKLIPKLVVFSVKPDDEGSSFIATKQKATLELGGHFELITYKKTPRFEDFARNIYRITHDDKTTGVVIQKPLPAGLDTSTIYGYVPDIKEIEGHKIKTTYCPPIALAVLTPLKYYFMQNGKLKGPDLIFDMDRDLRELKKIIKKRKIVVIGRGDTGGKPIGEVFTKNKINFIGVNSQTPNPERFYQEADIIMSAVGKKVLMPQTLKKGIILISIGLHRESDQWKGDYLENEIKDIASFYTPTPGGVGPLDIAYLMYNLVQATRSQK
ncbi:hypothetical protein A3H78_04785 [Candidatus Roizmanbacteria bacterium RIFCSPLOWO2_02_FULL_36_11]|uniref:Methenyltetrahydrofolate cyclohydrolase n=1 Tax=Candidatus Roizmanbacteria bacterium RIFCSPLOWO2_02_FULL_36_11 TaxID=1802071 RepID=A0A1F7JD24_9BACT|nr:MAG: hypothetical protein A3H78_04785 [Candidatus Roizmanbacteria bacterium RIFCSPLOWO2_02_FULL_36_11]